MICEKQFALPALVAIPHPPEELGNLRIQWDGCNTERLSRSRFCLQKRQFSRELQAVESALNVEKASPESIPLMLEPGENVVSQARDMRVSHHK
jgi:hypothetical protein